MVQMRQKRTQGRSTEMNGRSLPHLLLKLPRFRRHSHLGALQTMLQPQWEAPSRGRSREKRKKQIAKNWESQVVDILAFSGFSLQNIVGCKVWLCEVFPFPRKMHFWTSKTTAERKLRLDCKYRNEKRRRWPILLHIHVFWTKLQWVIPIRKWKHVVIAENSQVLMSITTIVDENEFAHHDDDWAARFRFCRRRHGRFAVYLTFTPLERLFDSIKMVDFREQFWVIGNLGFYSFWETSKFRRVGNHSIGSGPTLYGGWFSKWVKYR